MKRDVEISVIISTYNRSRMLRQAIDSVLAQDSGAVDYEVIVVDNNSTDETRDVVTCFGAAAGSRLKYIFEPRQGVSYARNAGIAAARGEIIAFIDDDVKAAPDWVPVLQRAFHRHPGIDFMGGKVLPEWESQPAAWITREHWMPLALLDYGNTPLAINAANPLCLLSANLAVRRHTFQRAGGFAPELQRVRNRIGSMEDHELLARLFEQGIQGRYVPELTVTTYVPAARLERRYHRRWHRGHGHFYAIMRSEEFEPASGHRLLGVPAHLYKQAARDAARWLGARLAAPDRSAACEMRLCFFAGFFRTRCRDHLHQRLQQRVQRRQARTTSTAGNSP